MDQGIFQRLRETTKIRHADVLLLCATTESPQNLFFFWRESVNLKREIRIDRKIISTFVHYDCPNNIGQLSTDIRLTCTNAYYKHLLLQREYLEIEF